jgi:hypothetical protein
LTCTPLSDVSVSTGLIAQQHKVHITTIERIWSGKTWYGVTRSAPDMSDFDMGIVTPPPSEERSSMHGDISSNKYPPP